MRALAILAAVIAMSGCSQPGTPGSGYEGGSNVPIADTLITTDAQEYRPGDLITIRLTNRLGRSIGYNLCRSRVERLDVENGEWGAAVRSLAEMCTAEIRTLGPGQAVTYSFRLTVNLRRPGRFRVSTDLDDRQARTRLIAVSNTFFLAGSDD